MRRFSGRCRHRQSAGFTLIELIIVIVVVSILVSIALPSYQASMLKGRRADAKAGLMDAANREERYMLDRSSYTADMERLGLGAGQVVSENGYYNLNVEPEDPNCPIASCYVLTATPVPGGAQADDTLCTSFSLKSTGARAATGSAASECW